MDGFLFRREFLTHVLEAGLNHQYYDAPQDFDDYQNAAAEYKRVLFEMNKLEHQIASAYENKKYIDTNIASLQQIYCQLSRQLEHPLNYLENTFPVFGGVLRESMGFVQHDNAYVQWLINQKNKHPGFDIITALQQWQSKKITEIKKYYQNILTHNPADYAQRFIHMVQHQQLKSLEAFYNDRLEKFINRQRYQAQTHLQGNLWNSITCGSEFVELEKQKTTTLEESAAVRQYVVIGETSKFPNADSTEQKPQAKTRKEISDVLRACKKQLDDYDEIGISLSKFPEDMRSYAYMKAARLGIDPDFLHGYRCSRSEYETAKKKFSAANRKVRQIKKSDETQNMSDLQLSQGQLADPSYFLPNNFSRYSLPEQLQLFVLGDFLQQAYILNSVVISYGLKEKLLAQIAADKIAFLFNQHAEILGFAKTSNEVLDSLQMCRLFLSLNQDKQLEIFALLNADVQKIIYPLVDANKKFTEKLKQSKLTAGCNEFSKNLVRFVRNKRKDAEFVSQLPAGIQQDQSLLNDLLKFNLRSFGHKNRIKLFEEIPIKLFSEPDFAALLMNALLLTIASRPEKIIRLWRAAPRISIDLMPGLAEKVVEEVFSYFGKDSLSLIERKNYFDQLPPQSQAIVLAQYAKNKRADLILNHLQDYGSDKIALILNWPGAIAVLFPLLLNEESADTLINILNSANLSFSAQVDLFEQLHRKTLETNSPLYSRLIRSFVRAHLDHSMFLAELASQLSLKVLPQPDQDYPYFLKYLTPEQFEKVLSFITDPELIAALRIGCTQVLSLASPLSDQDVSPADSVVSLSAIRLDSPNLDTEEIDDIDDIDDVDDLFPPQLSRPVFVPLREAERLSETDLPERDPPVYLDVGDDDFLPIVPAPIAHEVKKEKLPDESLEISQKIKREYEEAYVFDDISFADILNYFSYELDNLKDHPSLLYKVLNHLDMFSFNELGAIHRCLLQHVNDETLIALYGYTHTKDWLKKSQKLFFDSLSAHQQLVILENYGNSRVPIVDDLLSGYGKHRLAFLLEVAQFSHSDLVPMLKEKISLLNDAWSNDEVPVIENLPESEREQIFLERLGTHARKERAARYSSLLPSELLEKLYEEEFFVPDSVDGASMKDVLPLMKGASIVRLFGHRDVGWGLVERKQVFAALTDLQRANVLDAYVAYKSRAEAKEIIRDLIEELSEVDVVTLLAVSDKREELAALIPKHEDASAAEALSLDEIELVETKVPKGSPLPWGDVPSFDEDIGLNVFPDLIGNEIKYLNHEQVLDRAKTEAFEINRRLLLVAPLGVDKLTSELTERLNLLGANPKLLLFVLRSLSVLPNSGLADRVVVSLVKKINPKIFAAMFCYEKDGKLSDKEKTVLFGVATAAQRTAIQEATSPTNKSEHLLASIRKEIDIEPAVSESPKHLEAIAKRIARQKKQ